MCVQIVRSPIATTSAPRRRLTIFGSGAEVFLFGLDEPQTFRGYAVLLAHLARFLYGPERPEWDRTADHGPRQGPSGRETAKGFRGAVPRAVREGGVSPSAASQTGADPVPRPAGESFSNVPWSDNSSDEELFAADWSIREPVTVLDDARFQRFAPTRRRDLLSESVYLTTFQQRIDRVRTRLYLAMERIGVMMRRRDERLDMPDLFRVAAKLLKKSAMAPA